MVRVLCERTALYGTFLFQPLLHFVEGFFISVQPGFVRRYLHEGFKDDFIILAISTNGAYIVDFEELGETNPFPGIHGQG
jgi:hypothetical protein